MKRKIFVAFFLVLLMAGGLAGAKVQQIQRLIANGKAFVPPPESVSVVEAREEKWRDILTTIGSIKAVQGVTITPEISGTVREIAFESGAVVDKGNLLVRLDTTFEEAQLRAIEAQVELARINLAREKTLRADKMNAQAELDTAEATLKQSQASADTIRATIEKKTLRAPFAGRLGIRQINLGQYLDTGKPIVSLQSLEPVHADFSLPQQELARLKVGMRVCLVTDAYPERTFEGDLTAINPEIDVSTRSVGMQATFDNPDQLLRPGMYVRLEVLFAEAQTVLVIPATSVLSAPYGDSVYRVEPVPAKNEGKPGLTVRQQFIRTGRARGNLLTVESGLKAGDRIVNSGLFKLRNDMPVVETSSLTPKSEASPHPVDN